MTPSFYPVAAFDLIPNAQADEALVSWEHWLGACNRPFGRQSWGLTVAGNLVAVAVGASTVNGKCGGFDRKDVVELARLCAAPEHRSLTRVCLRLWRELAPEAWGRKYWLVQALVSYANAARHRGDIYRFDGWSRIAEVKGGTAGKTWARPRKAPYEAKVVWAYGVTEGGAVTVAQRKLSGSTDAATKASAAPHGP